MSSWLTDLRYAARMLRKNAGLTAIIALILALGIGANTTIFSVFNAFLLRPLPYAEPDRLLHLFLTDAQSGHDQVRYSLPQFLDQQAQSEAFSDLAVYDYTARNLTDRDADPEQQIVGRLSANLLPLLGVEPRLGRGFASGEDSPGAGGVILLSEELWQRRYGGREDVLGEALHIDGEPHTVIGIMAPHFHFPYPEVKLWVPLPADREIYDRDNNRFLVIGRLAAGVAQPQAMAELATIQSRLSAEYPATDGRLGVNAVPLRQALLFAYDEIRLLMMVLTAAVGFVLLIVAANVANILLAKAAGRASEVAIRSSLGADRSRLLRQFLTESSLLALLGGALGIAFAVYGVRLLAAALPEALFRVGALEIDVAALAFTLALSLITAVLFGLAPALRGARVDLSQTLKEGGRNIEGSRRQRRLRSLLVVAQLSLAVVLLSGAFMLIGTGNRMQRTELGFDPERLLTMRLALPVGKYQTAEQRAAFFDDLTRRFEGLRGIEAAAAVGPLPLSFSTYGVEIEVPGRQPTSPEERLAAHYITATPHYFDALGIPLRRGRVFDDRDRADSAGVVVVNDQLAERYWPGEDPLGRSLHLRRSADSMRSVTVVGVVAKVRDAPEWQGEASGEQLYVPWAQAPRRDGHVVVRAADGDPKALIPQIREQLRLADADLPVSELWTMDEVLAYSVSPLETASRLLTGFAAVAMFLAVVGIYGVVAYTTSRRQHELGIRLALGAGRGSILRLVLSQGAGLATLGVGLGLSAAFTLGRVVASQMPGIVGPGAGSLATVALILGAAALGATFFPARRAAQLDPLRAIRYE